MRYIEKRMKEKFLIHIRLQLVTYQFRSVRRLFVLEVRFELLIQCRTKGSEIRLCQLTTFLT